MKTKLCEIVAGLAVAGLLAAAPASVFAAQAAAQAPAAKAVAPAVAEERVHPPWPGRVTEAPVAAVDPAAKSINEKGIKKTEAPPVDAAISPPADAGKGHSEKGVK